VSDRRAVPVIAVVDDDKSVRESLADLAESVGYDVVLFSSAEEFLRLTRYRKDLGCLILDVRLPGKSGPELYTQLALSNRALPTIFITAHADPAADDWSRMTGVVSVLYKPFQPEVLLEAVRSVFAKSGS
jgi:FixJ family two-component response regulator